MSFLYDMYIGKIQLHANGFSLDLGEGGGHILKNIFLFPLCLIGDIMFLTQIFKKELH